MTDDPEAAIATPTADPPSKPSIDPMPPSAQDDPAQAPSRDADPAPPDGGKPAGEPADDGAAPPPAWAALTTEQEVFDHESLQSLHEERDAASIKKGRAEAQGRMQPEIQRQAHLLNGIDQATSELSGALLELRDAANDNEGPVSLKELDKLLTKHGATVDTLGGIDRQRFAVAGWSGIISDLGKEAGVDDLAERFSERLAGLMQRVPDPTLIPDILEALTGAAVKAALTTDRPKTAKQTRENYDTELRQLERNGTKPPAKPTGSAGGGKSADLNTVKGINAAARAGQLSPTESAQRIQDLAAGSIQGG